MSAMVDASVPPSGTGCVECEVAESWWVHLRRCAECGHIGCCDSSLGKHATAHANATGHDIMRSFEPGEDWFWDYTSAAFVDGPELAAPLCHPRSQTVPGPADRVPADWQEQLAAQSEQRVALCRHCHRTGGLVRGFRRFRRGEPSR